MIRSPTCPKRLFAASSICLVLVGTPLTGNAQLISPGKLAAQHSHLEGMRNCTVCHELRQRGTSNDLCLACHEPLKERILQNRGYHSTLADQNCAECHKDHFGRAFEMVRFDTTSFEHSRAGFDLLEAHAEAGCRDCHVPDLVTDSAVRAFKTDHDALARSYLGLGTTCEGCHASDDPHGGQFPGRECQECHTQTVWLNAEYFDHANTRYRLTGLHERAPCDGCHEPLASDGASPDLKYVGVPNSGCESCHRDVHRSSMVGVCSTCHVTGGWLRIDRASFNRRFDHGGTDFALVGAHADVECASCHGRPPMQGEWLSIEFTESTIDKLYPTPFAGDCLSCHRDYHQGAFQWVPGGTVCENCHSQQEWTPATYGIDRHNRETDFVLTGAHAAAPCFRCHGDSKPGQEAREYAFDSHACTVCHRSDDPHGGQFAERLCTQCHDTRSFAIDEFDHDATSYPLDGAHRSVPCRGCHLEESSAGLTLVRYTPIDTECRTCHGEVGG